MERYEAIMQGNRDRERLTRKRKQSEDVPVELPAETRGATDDGDHARAALTGD